MSQYLGDKAANDTLYFGFNTHKADGTPITLAGTPAISIYDNDTLTESNTGVTLTVDFDSRIGYHVVKVVCTDAFYATGHQFKAVLTSGTVDSISVLGVEVAHWTIEKNAALRPTVAGRTLDVAATGEAGIDLTNRLDTTGILPSAQAGAASGLAIVGSKMDLADSPNVTGLGVMVTAMWDKALTGIAATGSIGKLIKDYLDAAISTRSTYAGGAVASVTAGVTVATNNDKDGYSLSTAPPTAAAIREEMDDHSTQLAAIAVGVGLGGSETYPATSDPIRDSGGSPIEGVTIECYASSDYSGNPVQVVETDINGIWTFHLNPGTYYFRIVEEGYDFAKDGGDNEWSATV